MQNRGILITLRAAAIIIIVTGLNDVVASAVPRYEPLYLYLAAVAFVALADGIFLGIAAATVSVAFYALLFMPRADALSPAIATPAAAAIGVAIAGSIIRGLVRSRRPRRAPAVPVMPALLETSAVAHVTDNAEVLEAIDELRNELRTAIADLGASRSREGELADRNRSHAAEVGAMELRIRQFEHDRDWALKVAEEGRVRAERERGARAEAERMLADAREESATMAGRLAELELSLREAEGLQRDNTVLRARIVELESSLRERDGVQRDNAALRAHIAELESLLRVSEGHQRDNTALRSHIAELESSLRKSEALQRDNTALRARIAELESSLRVSEGHQRDNIALRSRVTDLESSLLETENLHRDNTALRALVAELEAAVTASTPVAEVEELRRALSESRALQRQAAAALADERVTREKLEEETRNYDKKLQTIVTHLASDHEADLGQALSDKEQARAEARALSMKLGALQRKYDEEAVKIRDAETLLTETRAAAQTEIDRLRAAVASNDAPRGTRPRVMIVHPDADLRATASATLERAGYDVVSAADGLEALRVAIARQPDVVIAETSMPKMDGRELCQLLKSQEKTAHIRVVLLMRASDEEPRGDLPPDEILRKPVPVETLKATLANLLSSRAV